MRTARQRERQEYSGYETPRCDSHATAPSGSPDNASASWIPNQPVPPRTAKLGVRCGAGPAAAGACPRMKHESGGEYAGNGAAGPYHRIQRSGVRQDLCAGPGQPAQQIEDDEPQMAHRALDAVAQQPEQHHVARQMPEIRMKEHRRITLNVAPSVGIAAGRTRSPVTTAESSRSPEACPTAPPRPMAAASQRRACKGWLSRWSRGAGIPAVAFFWISRGSPPVLLPTLNMVGKAGDCHGPAA